MVCRCIKALTKLLVTGHLQKSSGQPDGSEQGEVDPKDAVADPFGLEKKQQDRRRHFCQHRRGNDPSRPESVSGFVASKLRIADKTKKWVVDDLHEPNHARHE